jgi:hypothetical protein
MANETRTVAISEIKPDKNNANKGTVRGKKLVKESIKELGLGRSILVDKNMNAIAGNKTLEQATKLGYKKVIVVDSAGDTLVAVRRTDLDIKDKKGQKLGIIDNRASEEGLEWDLEALKMTDADLTGMFDERELDILLNEGKNSRQPNTIDLQEPPKMVWVLLGIPFNRFDLVQENLSALESESEITVQSARNE